MYQNQRPLRSPSTGGVTLPADDEQPWVPRPADIPYNVLLNPHGTRHLAFDDRGGMWLRLWQHRAPEPVGADGACLLRPSDIDTIIKLGNIWIMRNPHHPRAQALTDELARGAKALVVHYARLAGAN